MPKTPIDYSKTVIYKLVCNDLNITECYVGNTTDFIRRKRWHKHWINSTTKQHDKEYNVKKYEFIRCNGGWENWTMIEIEKYPCLDSNESHARERYWYEKLDAKLNMQVPNRQDDEYNQFYKETSKERSKEYRSLNKERISANKKKYRNENLETVVLQEKASRERCKKSNQERKSLKYDCECGGKYTHCHKARHLKTIKHCQFIDSLQ